LPVGVISNSEGRLAELIAELGWAGDFDVVADSGRLRMEKPELLIFLWTAERLGVPPERIVHVGDSWEADVEGAYSAGMRAVWFRPRAPRLVPPELAGIARIGRAGDADGVRALLTAWGA
jgi:FMN phosphatase YigB (HAD superfamily)